jgi:DNA-binding CsgD family transcriptional regulator
MRTREWLRAPTDPDGRAILPRFPLDIADEVPLARIALATRDGELAQVALSTSRRRAQLNPGVHSIAATAAHARGLLDHNHTALRAAVDRFERAPRRLEMAAALEDLGTELATTSRESAVDVLSHTLAVYTDLGATWDARRVRSHLRELGARSRLDTAEPETSGWATMTALELAVARLVARGLTNREVAERLFISPHTVNSHLRHVFSKLGIDSRVELARLGPRLWNGLIVWCRGRDGVSASSVKPIIDLYAAERTFSNMAADQLINLLIVAVLVPGATVEMVGCG